MHPLYVENYVPLPGFMSTEEAADLYAFLDDKRIKQECYFSDYNFTNTPCFSNDLPLVRLLVRELPRVSSLIGEPVLPTYGYARIYKQGDVLRRHRDRPACEISVTLNLYQDKEWPIWFQKPNGEEVSILQSPGDATLYLGCVADHWREPYTGNNYGQVFLHYVRAYGDKANHVFDRIDGIRL